jgi:hypothetical protein
MRGFPRQPTGEAQQNEEWGIKCAKVKRRPEAGLLDQAPRSSRTGTWRETSNPHVENSKQQERGMKKDVDLNVNAQRIGTGKGESGDTVG